MDEGGRGWMVCKKEDLQKSNPYLDYTHRKETEKSSQAAT